MKQERGEFMVQMKKRSRLLALLALLAVVPMVSGCYGRFPLTHAVYEFNGDVTENPVGQTLVLWAFAILPVYGGAMLADAIVINTLEYWTDERIDIGQATLDDGSVVTFAPKADGSSAMLTVERNGATLAQREYVKMADGSFQVLDESGKQVGGVVPTANGQLQLTDAGGQVIQTISPRNL